MIITAKIVRYDGVNLLLVPDESIDRELLQKDIKYCELRLDDGRTISAEQRKKTYALIGDISSWSGENPEYLKQYFKWHFCAETGNEWFSLSNTSVSQAREFISYLIDFCLLHNVPCQDALINQTDDIGKYLYQCLEHGKCAICNKEAEIHHVDRVGMGRNRKRIVHKGMKAISLCRFHHMQAHNNETELFDKYHIYGIELDDYLCKILKLKEAD